MTMNLFPFREKTFETASYETDFTGKLSLFSLFNHFQDIAGKHAEQIGVGFDYLRSKNLAWMLSRIILKISYLPEWGERVVLKTWPKGIEGLFAMRDFSLISLSGEIMISATSAWLLVDLTKNRPSRLENLPVNLKFTGAPSAIEEIPGKIKLPEKLVGLFEHNVLNSDIDINQHVNNANYAKWIFDSFPAEKYKQSRIRSLQINYLEAALPNDAASLLLDESEPGIYTLAGRSRNTGRLIFSAEVIWDV